MRYESWAMLGFIYSVKIRIRFSSSHDLLEWPYGSNLPRSDLIFIINNWGPGPYLHVQSITYLEPSDALTLLTLSMSQTRLTRGFHLPHVNIWGQLQFSLIPCITWPPPTNPKQNMASQAIYHYFYSMRPSGMTHDVTCTITEKRSIWWFPLFRCPT